MYRTLSLLALLPLCASAESGKQRASIPESYDDRICAVEKRLDRGYNAPFQKGRGLLLSADALYWTARETGLAYALKVDNTTVLHTDELEYKVKQPEYDWDFGFRTSLGYSFQRDGWDLSLSWTHFFTHAEHQGSLAKSDGYIPIWASPNFLLLSYTADQAEAKWKLNFNQVDLLLGRGFYVGKYFIVRPFFGPSGLWIDQHYNLEYDRKQHIPGSDHVKFKNAFKGVGLNAGCDLLFAFRHGWSIYGKAAGGLYYGDFEIKRKEKYVNMMGNPFQLSAKHHLRVGAPAIAVAMGFRWDHPFSKERYSFSAKLMWEHLLFFSQNQLFRFITPSSSSMGSSYVANQGDLTLQGGSFSLLFGF